MSELRLSLSLMIALVAISTTGSAAEAELARIPSGSYVPFFVSDPVPGAKPAPSPGVRSAVPVKAFEMEVHPVTRSEYLEFVKANPRWRKSRVPGLFADGSYLKSWKSDLDYGGAKRAKQPVTYVSWFAAKAYCEWRGMRLPSVDEWEYVGDDHGKGRAEATPLIMAWYSRPATEELGQVGSTPKNGYGVADLHGLIWEWQSDFNNAMVTEDSREGGSANLNLFCGAGGARAVDPSDYATFMRYAFRGSLSAKYTLANLGFRCAKEIER